jgi:hypothetical protein
MLTEPPAPEPDELDIDLKNVKFGEKKAKELLEGDEYAVVYVGKKLGGFLNVEVEPQDSKNKKIGKREAYIVIRSPQDSRGIALDDIVFPEQIIFDNSTTPRELTDKINKIFQSYPKPKNKRGPGAQMMPGITPTTLYNFYHIATLESQGRIKSDYGRELVREYLTAYRQKYLDTIGPLVADQIKKYIGRGRVDAPVTQEALDAAADDPAALDELMRQTYRSDMRRRNDVWNNITEHLRGLAAAGTTRDIIFRIDRLNNAIHNTNELLFSKFRNAGELMDAFEAINDARDERAYGRMVDKDLRDIEEFEGGPGARFMPDVPSWKNLSREQIQNEMIKFAKTNKALGKSMTGHVAWLTPDASWINVAQHSYAFPDSFGVSMDNYDDDFKATGKVIKSGFVRVVEEYEDGEYTGETLFAEGLNITPAQKRELKNTAIEKGLELVIDRAAQFMPADTSRLIDIEGVRPFKIPRPVKIGKNRWRVGDVVTSKEPDADAAAMIAGLQRLAMHSKGVDSRKALSSVFVTLRDNPYFKRLLAMSQENLRELGMDELYRGVGLDEKRSQLTRDAKSFTQFYDLADMVAEANAESRRGLEPEVLRISPVGKFPVIEDGAIDDIAKELGINRSKQPHMPGKHMEGAFGEDEVFVAPSSARPNVRFMPAGPLSSSQVDQSLAGVTGPDADQGPLSGARFMPGYNPRYTDEDGNFDFGLYSEDKRKTIAYLRDRMGITRKDFPDEEEWKRTIRETMRDVIRGG